MNPRRWPLAVIAGLGVGLVLAAAAFGMFDRAPKGGDMIEGFEPYMTDAEIEGFRGDLAVIGAARGEAAALLASTPPETGQRYRATGAFVEQWPAIDADMGSMLTTMQENIGRYDGVASLPPFPLFPFFFVVPGLLIAGVAGWSLVADGGRGPAPGRRIALIALGVGLIAAPAVFQMFSRAPGGAAMIEDFEPFMTETKVTQIQGYFLTIGSAEGQLRLTVLPEQAAAGAGPFTAVEALNRDWPEIANGMAPMIGAMADNVGNFEAVVALPPFWLFPWFFVVPGLAVVVLAVAAGARRPAGSGGDAGGAPASETVLEGV